MVAEILAVGTELLMGQIVNTNAQYITKRLNDLGVNVYYHSVVGDNPARLKECLRLALNRCDVVITTGGLGPTRDDITKETVAEIMGIKLVRHEETFRNIKCFFERVDRKMMANNIKQADIPEGCILIPNHNGTAPGFIIEKDGKTVIMLPGPPKEMIPMFEETVSPYFEKKTGQVIGSRMLKVFGIGESEMEMKILDLIENQSNPTIAPYVNMGEVVIRVTARSRDYDEAMKMIDPVIEKIKKRLGSNLYACNGETLEETVVQLLIEKNISISTAESCTGGMLASKLVNVPGVSKVFTNGFITYSNQLKTDVLGVSPDTISKFGAVSKETAVEMVKGLVKKTATRAGIAITGIAGPDGGTPEKPAGTVWIAVMLDGDIEAAIFKQNGDRERVRHMACLNALNMLRKKILGLK
ncbi:MAG: competence/damage-inducible protein A [Clostridiaceae bacterium]|nr:competence/damage-inducible protein A [Clostridiaceae bacterium]